MAEPILQPGLSHAPWRSAQTMRLPGTMPVPEACWLTVDAAYAAQMAERERLLAGRRDAVVAARPGSAPALAELLEVLLAHLAARPDFDVGPGAATCPDGRIVPLERRDPLGTLGRLVQEDFCLMERPADSDEHVLTAAVLCFPASWTLAEKIGRPLLAIHAPVARYDASLSRRVQRLFDAIAPTTAGGSVLMRMNAFAYAEPELFHPRREAAPRPEPSGEARFLRLERQTLRRLPDTGAVAFAIHTTVVDRMSLAPEDRAAFARHAALHD